MNILQEHVVEKNEGTSMVLFLTDHEERLFFLQASYSNIDAI